MMFLGTRGYRVIAHDRRGHGRSDQPWNGNDMDTYADDLSALLDKLEVREAVLVGHSTGGGEVARYIGRHGTGRVAKAVLLGAVPPCMLKSDHNTEGTPLEVFDSIRASVLADRSQFFKDLTIPFYGFNRPNAKTSEGLRNSFWLMGMQASINGAFDCIKQFSETDFTEDLKKMNVPTLVAHGDDDQIVPFNASARLSAKLAPKATLKVYAEDRTAWRRFGPMSSTPISWPSSRDDARNQIQVMSTCVPDNRGTMTDGAKKNGSALHGAAVTTTIEDGP